MREIEDGEGKEGGEGKGRVWDGWGGEIVETGIFRNCFGLFFHISNQSQTYDMIDHQNEKNSYKIDGR